MITIQLASDTTFPRTQHRSGGDLPGLQQEPGGGVRGCREAVCAELSSRTAVAFGHRPRGGDAADMKCTQGRSTLYAPHGLAWVTYRLSVTPIGGCVDPLARRSSRLDGQEYCQVTTREAECCIMCSQGNPDVSRPRSGGGRRVAGRLRGAWPGK